MEGGPASREQLLATLGVKDEQLLGAFVWGSRAFGTSTTSSDWDLYVVVQGFVGPLAPPVTREQWRDPDDDRRWAAFCRGENLDATVYERDYWQEMLDYHDIHIMLCQSSLPSEFVIKRYPRFHIPEVVELMKLKFSVYVYIMGPRERALKMYRQGDLRGAKKSLVHCLRYLLMATEVAKTRRHLIRDHTLGNSYHEEVFNVFPEGKPFTWDELLAWYTPIAERLLAEFKDLANIYKTAATHVDSFLMEVTQHKGLPSADNFATVNYIQKRLAKIDEEASDDEITPQPTDTFDRLSRFLREELSVVAYRDRNDSSLIHFIHCLVSSPPSCSVVRECCGLVLRYEEGDKHEENTKWSVACMPFFKMWNFTGADIDLEALDSQAFIWDGCRLWEKPVGISAFLFYIPAETLGKNRATNEESNKSGKWMLSFSTNNFFARSRRRQMEKTVMEKCGRRLEELEWHRQLETWFWETWSTKGWTALPREPGADEHLHHRTYMFRFVPANDGAEGTANDCRLVLVGARDRHTLRELDPLEISRAYSWTSARERSDILQRILSRTPHTTESWTLQRKRKLMEELRAEASALSPLEAEGWILCDHKHSRLGIPSIQFSALSCLAPFLYRFNKQPLMLAVARACFHEAKRFCAFYPEWRQWFAYVSDKLHQFAAQVQAFYDDKLRSLSDRELAQRLKEMSKPLQNQRRHMWKQHKRSQELPSATDSVNNADEEGDSNDAETIGLRFGDMSRLFWAIRRREQNRGKDSREQNDLASSETVNLALTCLLSWEARTDGPFTHKIEEWLWKADNALITKQDKLVPVRHASHRPTTLLRREETRPKAINDC